MMNSVKRGLILLLLIAAFVLSLGIYFCTHVGKAETNHPKTAVMFQLQPVYKEASLTSRDGGLAFVPCTDIIACHTQYKWHTLGKPNLNIPWDLKRELNLPIWNPKC